VGERRKNLEPQMNADERKWTWAGTMMPPQRRRHNHSTYGASGCDRTVHLRSSAFIRGSIFLARRTHLPAITGFDS
jgi:hypothetical protein